MYGFIFSLLTLTISVLIIVIVVYAFVISQNTVALIPPPPAQNVPPPINWSENLRKNESNGYMPPCSQSDPFIKYTFAVLRRLNLVSRYFTLLDVLSVILCYESDSCNSVFDKERLTQVINMGGDPHDKDALAHLKSFAKVDKVDSPTTRFLVAALNLVQKQSNLIKIDKDIPRQDADAILGHIYAFNVSHIDNIYKLCP